MTLVILMVAYLDTIVEFSAKLSYVEDWSSWRGDTNAAAAAASNDRSKKLPMQAIVLFSGGWPDIFYARKYL